MNVLEQAAGFEPAINGVATRRLRPGLATPAYELESKTNSPRLEAVFDRRCVGSPGPAVKDRLLTDGSFSVGEIGVSDGIRTRIIRFGRPALSHFELHSLRKCWKAVQDSNPHRPRSNRGAFPLS